MPSISELVDQIHENGVKIALQFNHPGGMFGVTGEELAYPP